MARHSPCSLWVRIALMWALWPALVGASPEPPEILVSRQLMEFRGIAVGDVVRLGTDPGGQGAREFRVSGSYEPVPNPFILGAKRHEVRLHLPDLVALRAPADDPIAAESVTRINVALVEAQQALPFRKSLAAKMPGLIARPAVGSGTGSDPFVVLERFHLAIAAVTVLGSSAFLLALMVMRSEERRQTAGILRLVGLTRSRILLGGFVEGLLIALGGAVFGVVLALAVQGLFNRFFQWYYDTALVFARVTPGIVVRCVLLAIPLGVLAGIAASWTLLRGSVLSLIRR